MKATTIALGASALLLGTIGPLPAAHALTMKVPSCTVDIIDGDNPSIWKLYADYDKRYIVIVNDEAYHDRNVRPGNWRGYEFGILNFNNGEFETGMTQARQHAWTSLKGWGCNEATDRFLEENLTIREDSTEKQRL